MTLIPANRTDAGHARARVRAWTREIWRLEEADAVVVVELVRSEPCPGPATVIVIATGDGTTFEHTLLVPAAEIRRDDLQSLAEQATVTQGLAP